MGQLRCESNRAGGARAAQELARQLAQAVALLLEEVAHHVLERSALQPSWIPFQVAPFKGRAGRH
eukprot:3980755-Pyramimonas_sp.AAC.1